MCKNLVEKGKLEKPLIVYNRTTKRAEDLSSKIGHSTVATSIADAVSKADIVFFCLGDDAAVLEIVETILQSDVKGKLLVDCSTIHPDSTTKENDLITKAGASFVAMPVFGAPAMADAGQLVCVLAGPADAVEKVKPFTKGVMGRADIDYSDQPPSKATLLKIIGNTFIASMISTISEGQTLAEKSGLGADQLHLFIETMFPGPHAAYSTRMKSGDYYKREEPLFAVDLALKDMRHAQKIANDNGMQLRNAMYAEELLNGVKDHMGARGDIAGMVGAKRKESGLEFEN
jgi:3-hydroxyisobutyrate dehydrogenase-like beta-hydroxyacid dehydrogenase